eukprot:765349-Hanusia_phi.AAC.3
MEEYLLRTEPVEVFYLTAGSSTLAISSLPPPSSPSLSLPSLLPLTSLSLLSPLTKCPNPSRGRRLASASCCPGSGSCILRIELVSCIR